MISKFRQLKKAARDFARRGRGLGQSRQVPPIQSSGGHPLYRRYLSNRPGDTEAYLAAARNYVANKTDSEYDWLYCKPYARNLGNEAFFTEMYQVMNLLQAMDISLGGRILEVGSGPGWVTEILVSLGFEVHGLEPSAEMIRIARERVAAAISHWHIKNPPPYEFHCQTLEDCTLPDEEYDAIFFHAALHHVIDEEAGFRQCYRLLRPGGILGISEAAWQPGNRALEDALDEEMARFGTLENPYTQEYLDDLLVRHGFINIDRYHQINGFIPVHKGKASIESLADAPAHGTNNLTAVKQGQKLLTTRDTSALTRAKITLLQIENGGSAETFIVKVKVKNIGDTLWLQKSRSRGWVTLAVRSAVLSAPDFEELPRTPLPQDIEPGEDITLNLQLQFPKHFRTVDWHIDLVNEELFWFSSCGSEALPLVLP